MQRVNSGIIPLLRAYLSLTKPRVLSMVGVITAAGFVLAGGDIVRDFDVFLWAIIGTCLTGGGASALNCYLERNYDAKMARTCTRPIPAGIIPPHNALAFGEILTILGTAILCIKVNMLTGFLAILTAFLYVLVYTPMKRITWLNTLLGAIPGALPPVGGWVAASGSLDIGAWLLFLVLFIWQEPHFFAIAWIYRDDYARGGFKMLPVIDKSGEKTLFHIVFFSSMLIPTALLPYFLGLTGIIYFIGAALLGCMMLYFALMMRRNPCIETARSVLRSSLVYLPLLLVIIVVDRI